MNLWNLLVAQCTSRFDVWIERVALVVRPTRGIVKNYRLPPKLTTLSITRVRRRVNRAGGRYTAEY